MSKLREALKSLYTVFSAAKFHFLAMCAFGLCSGPLSAIFTEYSGKFIDTAIAGVESGELDATLNVLLIALGVALAGVAAQTLATMMSNRVDERINMGVQEQTLRISTRIDYLGYTSREHIDERSAFADESLSFYVSVGMSTLTFIISDVAVFVSYAVLLCAMAGYWALTGAVVMLVLSYIIVNRKHKLEDALHDDTVGERRYMEYVESLCIDAAPYLEHTLFGYGARIRMLFKKSFEQYSQKKYAAERGISRHLLLLELLSTVITVAFTSVFFVLGTISSPGEAVVFFTLFTGLITEGKNIGMSASMVGTMIERITLFNNYRDKYAAPQNNEAPLPRVKGANAVELEDVSFSYDGEHNILDHISLEIAPGQTVGLVGENGAGKTTLSNIILGIYPCEGRADIFGRNGYEARRQGEVDSTAVFQRFGRFEGLTLEQNIAFDGKADRAALGALDGFFNQAELSAMTGEKFDGVNYSGGQWQKIALARCMQSGADILVLDEPTAALDPMAEAEVFSSFMDATRGKTKLLITHRLGAVRNADVILVLKDAKICERGSHDELMKQNGYYAAMFNAQAQWYRMGDTHEE